MSNSDIHCYLKVSVHFFGLILFVCFVFLFFFSVEEKRTHAGHKIQVLKNLIMALESTTFFVQDHAYTKSRTCKAIILQLAMSRSVTY